jgi:hypothetical protein
MPLQDKILITFKENLDKIKALGLNQDSLYEFISRFTTLFGVNMKKK